MTNEAPQKIYLADYKPFPFLIDGVELNFDLAPRATRVKSKINFRPNPDSDSREFFLHGENLKLISAKIDGKEISPEVTDLGLTADVPDAPFVFEAVVEISPETNTALEGLYMSGGMYCTQCEAEGFRKITYYPDRPDVMAKFKVRIQGSESVLLSNGNPVEQGEGFAEWHDPWPKPAYLFALVAGNLVAHPDSFTTNSGKEVELNIYVRPGDEGKCAFGMGALKRSMTWDEEVYGREYDLDIFNIVAVDDFNMGAMENKGLNIFNSSCVLASPETATDANFERIEGIIAHEYFHNWTGNRITCRDWFQLCLKEGLTVFRDQQFTSDMRSRAVKRIDDVITLRARQFREDNGPLAHPVRPESFVEINNFYTATVYDKGAEIIGMLKRLVGDENYKRALDLYFERHDGEAATIEDWLKVFEDTTGRDLSQFALWYSQAGTPRLKVSEAFEDGTYILTFKQETPPTPGQPEKDPRVIPIAVGLLNPNGDEVRETCMLEMTEEEQSFRFSGLAAKPIPSILREFSAPVILERETTNAERAFLLAHDTDPFNKWEAGRALAKDTITRMLTDDSTVGSDLLDAISKVLRDDSLDPAFRALVLALPSADDIAQTLFDAGHTPDPSRIHTALETVALSYATHLQDVLPKIYADMHVDGPYSPDAEPAGKRALQGAVLSLLSRLDGGNQARAQFAAADNMTQQLQALACLLRIDRGREQLAAFEEQWKDDRLVMDKWFNLQTALAAPEAAVQTTEALTKHAAFDWKNPNRFRATLGGLTGNMAGFHSPDGSGYRLVADWLIKLDAANPQTTARMSTCFDSWRRYDADRQALIKAELSRILATPKLSRDTTEMVTRILGD
ncbi:aminopeptidase N [Halocynthiibacter sp. C4]|uniref:aminopeptidase N n=1 Tax=Halocynthiibacter sp. C4 TaxID=2992758 RepID=UPI00237A6C86|nr:aminopeptidase N [Halocynthiibacter sp. C4]MDE0589226.1 aminopeptidase N [Halocynthiibacter sp. C4]